MKRYLGSLSFYRQALMIGVPVMLQSLIQSLVSLVDNFMVAGVGDSYEEMEALLSNAGFLIHEHMDADEATDAFLKDSGIAAPAGVGYCLAVRKG